MNPVKRAWLFARDYVNEFGCAWSIARMRDCERNGGHRWKRDPAVTETWAAVFGRTQTCQRCGCSESVGGTTVYTHATTGTASNAANLTVRWQ